MTPEEIKQHLIQQNRQALKAKLRKAEKVSYGDYETNSEEAVSEASSNREPKP